MPVSCDKVQTLRLPHDQRGSRTVVYELCHDTASAYIHLLVVELAPLYVMIASMYTAIKEHGAANFYNWIRAHRSGWFDCGKAAFERMMWTGMLKFECGDKSDGTFVEHTVFLSPFEGNFRTWPLPRAICLLDWYVFFMCAGTVACCISLLWRTGEHSFNSAGYVAFTWNLEQSKRYNLMVLLTASGPIISGIYILIIVLSFTKAESDPGRGIGLFNMMFQLGLVAYPAKLLLIPATPIHHWTAERFAGIHFKRKWWCMFTQSNDAFGVTWWHGHFEKLDKLLDPSDTEAFLLAAGKMQDEEDSEMDPLVLSILKDMSPVVTNDTTTESSDSEVPAIQASRGPWLLAVRFGDVSDLDSQLFAAGAEKLIGIRPLSHFAPLRIGAEDRKDVIAERTLGLCKYLDHVLKCTEPPAPKFLVQLMDGFVTKYWAGNLERLLSAPVEDPPQEDQQTRLKKAFAQVRLDNLQQAAKAQARPFLEAVPPEEVAEDACTLCKRHLRQKDTGVIRLRSCGHEVHGDCFNDLISGSDRFRGFSRTVG
ncbi:hypothetical protein AK812_SmicGene13904 [Symbiodinium microadriaticum]|uniref:Uncharacterized protein n=2 Tax=Symbiodinium TaxID=2949 RepID=A0A1Q9E6Z7_SYMMI|nr:hypothetical protein AK812_SmicGene13904 [Symbiodinium microadriaticum]